MSDPEEEDWEGLGLGLLNRVLRLRGEPGSLPRPGVGLEGVAVALDAVLRLEGVWLTHPGPETSFLLILLAEKSISESFCFVTVHRERMTLGVRMDLEARQ